MLDLAEVKTVAQVVLGMLATSKTTTTLDVKNFLRGAFPTGIWLQSDVSDVMAVMPDLEYTDMGKFREYSLKPVDDCVAATATIAKVPDTIVTRGAMVNIIRNTRGKFFTATFKKKNGETRVLNGQVKKSEFMDNSGYISVRENGKTRAGEPGKRRIDPRTLTNVSFEGINYSLR